MTMSSSQSFGAAHTGWQTDEEALLFMEIERGRESGLPLKSVFESVAATTGRKPNSIRNYYYAKIKDDEAYKASAFHSAAFVPFTDDEMRSLLRTVLSAQAKGISVRACTLNMGNGDNKAMLRYQNKYRSLIKGNPELVRSVIDELENEGTPCFDPYKTTAQRKPGRPRKIAENLVDVVSDVINDLDQVEGLNVVSFFEALGTLAVSACKGVNAARQLDELRNTGGMEKLRFKEEFSELKAALRSQEAELAAQRDRFGQLLSLFRQLMNVNREFLGMTGVTKMSSLSNYVKELSRNVEDCERLMTEYAK